ncbi:hypothetical protein D9M69_544440 [compost metagenome]
MRHQPVAAPGTQILAHPLARRHLGQHRPELVGQAPIGSVLRALCYLLQRQLEQTVLGTVRQKHVVANLEVMLAPRRLAHLRHHVELPTEKTLFLLDTLVVEAHATLHQQIQLREKLPHHPLAEWRIEQLQAGHRGLTGFELQGTLNQLTQQPPALQQAIVLLMVLWQNFQSRATGRFKHAHVAVPL